MTRPPCPGTKVVAPPPPPPLHAPARPQVSRPPVLGPTATGGSGPDCPSPHGNASPRQRMAALQSLPREHSRGGGAPSSPTSPPPSAPGVAVVGLWGVIGLWGFRIVGGCRPQVPAAPPLGPTATGGGAAPSLGSGRVGSVGSGRVGSGRSVYFFRIPVKVGS